MNDIRIRNIAPTDFSYIISVIDDWWDGRSMSNMLPKLFFIHFRQTSFVAESAEKPVGFLVGFISQTYPNEAYIHFAGVHPEFRNKKIGQALYEKFFEAVKSLGCTMVRCVTSPVNKGSIAFHTRLGFVAGLGDILIDGIPVVEGYDGKGESRVLFSRALGA